MIKTNYLLAVWGLFAAFMFYGCTDLELDSEDSIVIEETEEGFTAVNVEEFLETAYRSSNGIVGFTGGGVWAVSLETSDELMIPTRPADWGNGGIHRLLQAHTWDSSHPDFLSIWNSMNGGIYVCNQILASNPSSQIEAETRTIRAYLMFQVIDLFGQVPNREVTQGVDENPTVLTRPEAFDFAVSELEKAVPDLPDGGPGTNVSKMTKAFAKALLAKFYLNKAVFIAETPAGPYNFEVNDMDKVIALCDEVASYGFELEDNYFDNFNALGSKEKILTNPYQDPLYWVVPQLHTNQGGWNGPCTLGTFYDIFEEDDNRTYYRPEEANLPYNLGFLEGPQQKADGSNYLNNLGKPLIYTKAVVLNGATNPEGIRVVKYDLTDGKKGDMVLMRYAEVRLMKAEAILRGGSPTVGETAQSIVDELRTKRGLSSTSTVDLEYMLEERGRELYWEGVRRTDQIRFETFTKTTWEFKTVTDDDRVLFPIPNNAILSNPNLVQNPGY